MVSGMAGRRPLSGKIQKNGLFPKNSQKEKKEKEKETPLSTL